MSLTWLLWSWIAFSLPGEFPAPVGPPAPLAGIRTTDRFPVDALIQDIFVGGACKNVSKIKAIGNKKGIGYFEQGGPVIGIERGILLATGPVGNAEGPNEKGDEGGDFKDTAGDGDLRNLTSAPIYDAVGVEFDFVPLDSIVTFRYVFASEEYCEFVGTSFNDVFGFFVSGPGINGPFSNNSQNVALVPGGREYVSINNINHLKNDSLFVRNEPRRDAERCQIEWKQTPNLGLIEFDGFTKPMTATLKLIPCQTYHLRLVIADVSDGNYDSAVFLEAESFNIGGNINLATGSTNGQDTILEGCNTGYFLARRRPGEKTDLPLTIGLRVSSASTAIQGQDFLPLPKIVTIPAGAAEAPVPIEILIDTYQEPIESIVLELDFPCACISDTARLFIEDPPPLVSGLKNQTICIGESIRLETKAEGGVPGYTYLWSTGDTTSFLLLQPRADTTVGLTITDACGRKSASDVKVSRRPPPVLSVQSHRDVCQGDTAHIPIAFTGEPPFSFAYSIGMKKDTVRNIPERAYLLAVMENGPLSITGFQDAFCEGLVKGSAEIRYYSLKTIIRKKDLSCAGQQDGQIEVEVSGGTPPYRFDWKGWAGDTTRLGRLPAGNFPFSIRDQNNCFTDTSVTIKEPPPLEEVSFDCRDLRGSFLVLSAKGGVPPYTYSIDGKTFQDQSFFDQLRPGDTYTLYTRDANNCVIQQTFLMPARYSRMVELTPSVKLELGEKYPIEPLLNIPLTLVGKLEWSPATHLSCANCLRPVLTALENETLLLKITDIFGCSDGASIIIKLNRETAIFVPTAFSPDGDGINDRLTVFADTRQVRMIKSLRVFNRWGLLVHESRDLAPNAENGGWDGKYRGQLLETGVYIYSAVLEQTDGNLISIQGEFSLIH